jgi:hypothetical protein
MPGGGEDECALQIERIQKISGAKCRDGSNSTEAKPFADRAMSAVPLTAT